MEGLHSALISDSSALGQMKLQYPRDRTSLSHSMF